MGFSSLTGLGARIIARNASKRRIHRPFWVRRRRNRTSKAVANPVNFNLLNETSNRNNKFPIRKCTNKVDEEFTRKKKGRGTGSYGNDCINKELNGVSDTIIHSSSRLVDDAIVMCDILTRLPAKSLMRFKCVCKHWRFLIEKDLNFINRRLSLSRTRPSVFIIIPIAPKEPFQYAKGVSYIHRGYKNWFMTAELFFDEGQEGTASAATVHTIREVDASSYSRILGPVNGLIGFYDPVINSGVRISNISTRQVTPWIKSTLLREFKDQEPNFSLIRQDVKCEMGFNPATKEHKVICIWHISHSCPRRSEMICEVLTVGDNKWRKIAEVPPVSVYRGVSVSVNGSIFYNTLTVNEKVLPTSIVAFDVGTEKFRTIGVPDFILSQPREIDKVFGRAVDLLEVSGHMALLSRMNGYTVKLWLFNDTGNQNWTEVIIKLPYCWGGDRQVCFSSVQGTDLIILISRQRSDGKVYNCTHHSYNWKNKTFTGIEFSGIPSSVPHFSSSSIVKNCVESLLPVQ